MNNSFDGSSTDTDKNEEVSVSLDNLVEDGKNKSLVKCQFCPSQILNPSLGEYSKNEFDLPKMGKKRLNQKEEETSYGQLTHFWKVPDMYTFENICFSHTVGQIKYLACADCEMGPIGYYDMNTKVCYVALARVLHTT